MNASTPTRPEERRRRSVEGPAWADTVPAWFRSEAFAEDLAEGPASMPPLLLRPRQRVTVGRDQRAGVAAQSVG